MAKKKKKAKISIHEAQFEDLPAILHLGEKLFTIKAPNLYRWWDEYEVMSFYQDDPELCLVAKQGKKVVGFALGMVINKRRSAWTYGHVGWLGIDPSVQRKGLATRLCLQLRDKMITAGARILLVDTQQSNVNALRFFAKLGFAKPQNHVYLSLNVT